MGPPAVRGLALARNALQAPCSRARGRGAGGWDRASAARVIHASASSGGRGVGKGNGRSTSIRWQVSKHLEYGEQLLVVGGSRSLGAWDLDDAVPMSWTEGDVWEVEKEVDIPPGGVVQYKYCIMRGGGVREWQHGPNRRVPVNAMSASDDAVEVVDTWIYERLECLKLLEAKLGPKPEGSTGGGWEPLDALESLNHSFYADTPRLPPNRPVYRKPRVYYKAVPTPPQRNTHQPGRPVVGAQPSPPAEAEQPEVGHPQSPGGEGGAGGEGHHEPEFFARALEILAQQAAALSALQQESELLSEASRRSATVHSLEQERKVLVRLLRAAAALRKLELEIRRQGGEP